MSKFREIIYNNLLQWNLRNDVTRQLFRQDVLLLHSDPKYPSFPSYGNVVSWTRIPNLDILGRCEEFLHTNETVVALSRKLIGRYYDSLGRPTGYYYKLQQKLSEAEKSKKASDDFKLKFPPCNVEFDADTGSRVWCSTKSGGIERDWVGVPRKIFEPGSKSHRCACINIIEHSSNEDRNLRIKNIEEYEECHPKAASCHVIT